MKQFLCTRPRLCSALTAQGFQGTQTPHPFRHGLVAWLFELNTETAAAIAEWYTAEGLPVPKSVDTVLNGGNK